MEVATTPTGILKKVAKRPLSSPHPGGASVMGSPTSRLIGVHWEVPTNLEDLLKRAGRKNGAEKSTVDELEGLLTHLSHQKGPALIGLLNKIQRNISVLNPRLERFVLAVLRIGWADQEKPVVATFRDFLMNLVTAQTYYTKPVVKMLMCNLLGIANRKTLAGAVAAEDFDLDAIEKRVFENSHDALGVILKITPLAGRAAVLQYAKECSPYSMTPDVRAHANYLSNVLEVSIYVPHPHDKVALLTIVVDRLVQLDAHVNKEEPDCCAARENLDAGMKALLAYVDRRLDGEKENSEEGKLYADVVCVFETHVLPAHCGHVQFALFYLLGRCPSLTGHFLEWLWRKFTFPNTPTVIRQAAVAYLSGLVSRAAYVGTAAMMACLEKISCWIHSYIDSAGGGGKAVSSSSHGAFYSACQALFYVVAFRHEELVAGKTQLAFMRSLRLNTIVMCRLNPLNFCMPHVVSNFSAIARNYQLAYCAAIIQRNSRVSVPVVESVLSSAEPRSSRGGAGVHDSHFPFDPYGLPLTKGRFAQFYREYSGEAVEEEGKNEEEDESEEDDEVEGFLAELEEEEDEEPKRRRTESTGSMEFCYGTSPGFRHNP